MNYTSIKRLVRKDLYLARWVILVLLITYLLAISHFIFKTPSWSRVVGMESWVFFSTLHVGVSFILIGGFALAMQTVLRERAEKVDVHMMSMPISPNEYYFAKVLLNGSIVGTAWLFMFVGMITMILSRDDMPNGLVLMVTLINVQSLAGVILLLAVALVFRTQSSISILLIAEFYYFLFFSGRYFDTLGVTFDVIRQDAIIWPAPLVAMLLGTVAFMVLTVVITRSLLLRKRDII